MKSHPGESSIVFWCRENEGSSSTAKRLLELLQKGWDIPVSDPEAVS